MFSNTNIKYELNKLRNTRTGQDILVSEANRILTQDLFTEQKILQNLKQYNKSFEIIDEEDVDTQSIFTPKEIKNIAINYRLKFLDSHLYKPEIPYEAILKIKDINTRFKKEIKLFKILSLPHSFHDTNSKSESILFVKTNYNNYYFIHSWGNSVHRNRKFKFWPLRNFETLAATVIFSTLVLTLCLPTEWITLDRKATYFSGYRAAAFFHLLIFNFGVTAYITFAFAKNFSSSIWNYKNDFD